MQMIRTGMCSLAAVLLVSPTVRADPPCMPIDTTIVTTYSTEGCTSPVGVCTVGTVPLGKEIATTRFRALTIVPGAEPDTLLYTGELVITTREGSITLRDAGVLNGATGAFFELQDAVGGTKKYKRVTGMLTSQGTATGTGFSGTLTGELCRVPGRLGDG